jgi:hypothetical protein
MASAEAGQPAPYRRDDAGKFANTAAEPDAPGAKPAAHSPDAAPQFTSLLSHVGAPRATAPPRDCATARLRHRATAPPRAS